MDLEQQVKPIISQLESEQMYLQSFSYNFDLKIRDFPRKAQACIARYKWEDKVGASYSKYIGERSEQIIRKWSTDCNYDDLRSKVVSTIERLRNIIYDVSRGT